VAPLTRRSALAAAGAAALGVAGARFGAAAAPGGSVPIIDTHIHLFDPNRPQGTPVVIPESPTAKTGSFPEGYRKLAAPFGVVGAIHIEASNWVEDNLWALEICARNDIMVGVIGNLNPEVPEFAEYLERYRRNPMFRGIRYGNIWGYDLVGQSRNGSVIDRLKLLAQADLAMDSATPTIELLPGFDSTPQTTATYESLLREFHQRPTVFVKLSQIIHRVNGQVSTELSAYKDKLDQLVETFGEDRVIFGSDYPNSDSTTPVQNVFRIAKEYYATRTPEAAEKYFWRNSLRAYRWIPRTTRQRSLS
jgi:L-fuconolactonase